MRNRNKEKEAEYKKLYRAKNRERIRESRKKKMLDPEFAESARRYNREYSKKNISSINARHRARRKSDDSNRLRQALCSNIYCAITLFEKNGRTNSLKKHGIDIPLICEKIGPRPKGFHLDHIVPLSALDMHNPIHIRIGNDYRNLRWITAKENYSKHTKVPEWAYYDPFLAELITVIVPQEGET